MATPLTRFAVDDDRSHYLVYVKGEPHDPIPVRRTRIGGAIRLFIPRQRQVEHLLTFLESKGVAKAQIACILEQHWVDVLGGFVEDVVTIYPPQTKRNRLAELSRSKLEDDAMGCSRELPVYQCHEQVWALEIEAVEKKAAGCALHFVDKGFAPRLMPQDWFEKHQPQAGNWFVVYKGGRKEVRDGKEFCANHAAIDGFRRNSVAVSAEGGVYPNIEDLHHAAEEYEATMKALDDRGVPRKEEGGFVYSLYGRVCYLLNQGAEGETNG
jgi:hypothetical protein